MLVANTTGFIYGYMLQMAETKQISFAAIFGEDDLDQIAFNLKNGIKNHQDAATAITASTVTTTAAARLRRRHLQGVSGAVSGPCTVFHHKQPYRRFVLRPTILQPSYQNPTRLRPTPSKHWSCEKQNLIFQRFHNRVNSPKPSSVQLLAQQQKEKQ